MSKGNLRIGGASGFWGDSANATRQLLDVQAGAAPLDFIVYDYLAEITMSILARARDRDPSLGYATSFLTEAMVPNLAAIKNAGVKIVSNAGGVNSKSCAAALEAALDEAGVDLKVAWVGGDDLLSLKDQLAASSPAEMFSGAAFPAVDSVLSINAYLGAFPIAAALQEGADIVITGRCVDSAVTLGACLYHFDWAADDFDRLAMGSLAGHIIECGPQATGGNFTDWKLAGDLSRIGYPIAEVEESGAFVCSKPEGTTGLVNTGTIAEQLVYEIGDPRAYLLPDVTCDFSQVTLTELGDDRVRVEGATGAAPTASYKVSATYADQFRGGMYSTFYGPDASGKAHHFAQSALASARRVFDEYGMPDYSDVSIELIGAESQYGDFSQHEACRELVLKLAVKHPMKVGVEILFKKAVELGLATPPGLSSFSGNRAKASPVVRLFSFLTPKAEVPITLNVDGRRVPYTSPAVGFSESVSTPGPAEPAAAAEQNADDLVDVPLVNLAWCRSGDKGDKANVGVIARRSELYPYIDRALTLSAVEARFAHFLSGASSPRAEKFTLPGIHGLNFLLHDALGGGGVASLRNDPQAKGYSQLLLEFMIPVPRTLAEDLA